jgi:glycosidase
MESSPRRLRDLDLASLRAPGTGFPSPESWQDQSLYFLLIDRFSDGDEQTGDNPQGTTLLAQEEDRGSAFTNEESAERWRKAGQEYVGGTLRGVRSKIGYLKRLGVTALWISPVLKQAGISTYHGYATQDFLRVNPHLGTAEDLRDLAQAAHDEGMRLVLDIVFNHAANVFSYEEGGTWTGERFPVQGWNDAQGQPSIPFVKAPEGIGPDDAVWPEELQDPEAFHQMRSIGDWDRDPEFREGDFFDLKDFDHGTGGTDDYQPSAALRTLTDVYKYWIAYADLDGFRIDTVKHMDPGAVRFFVDEIRDFAKGLGKEDFFLVGEVTGSRGFALDIAEQTGLDAALGICGEPTMLAATARGQADPIEFFRLFNEDAKSHHDPFSGHTVSVIDDHDQVCRGDKGRFASDATGAKLVLAANALNILTLGIPCIYYGSEQGFDGKGTGDDAERYIRESMFGGEFGAFGSRCVHFFDESSKDFEGISALLHLRNEDAALRRGGQFFRETSGDGEGFGFPHKQGKEAMRALVAWSRVLEGHEVVVAINTDPDNATTAWVTLDGTLHQEGDILGCAYCPGEDQPCERTVEARNGLAIQITVPAGGVAVYR